METVKSLNVQKELEDKKFQLIMKRIFDITASVVGLVILSPIFILISIFIKLDSRGPVFFRQIRVGLNKKEFKIFKFRTMVNDAEVKGRQITVGNDNRITNVGYFIRKYKIDEFPQLINVLKGEMSLVGPRPEVPSYVELYDEEQEQVLMVKPGITDYASIEFRNENEILGNSLNPEEEYIENIMPMKIGLNLKYINEISVLTDVKIILNTLVCIIK
ncbi:sugar transferase [Paraclostridium sordellii]|uniref:sugar transferase n=1 Tax=Paraclostridium sordellii TaxID=1505 RepID=UPI0022E60BE2|nr:sugar transferase [Paeniclostridium sordellii]